MALVLFGWIAVVAAVFAHDPGLSTAEVQLSAEAITITVSFSPADARCLLPSAAGDLRAAAISDETWLEVARSWCRATTNRAAVFPVATRVLVNDRDTLRFALQYPAVAGAHVVMEMPHLDQLPGGHRQFAIVIDTAGEPLTKRFLAASDARLEFDLPPSQSAAAKPRAANSSTGAFGGFFVLGVEHIWTGYDHLLFLLALLMVCRRWRSIAATISCFTLAHSLTLAAATLNLVSLPSRFVEPAIAASIIFVAVENLARRGAEPRGRAALTFAFGLIHGFGFASVLRDLGVGHAGAGVVVPLFAFNAGVEVGQMAVAMIVLPVIWQLRKRPFFVARCVPAMSLSVGCAGTYWFLARTVLA